MLTQSELKLQVNYNPDTGIFNRLVSNSNRVKVSDVVGTFDHSNGYIKITINKKTNYAHRLAWLYVHGEMPSKQIDHINGIRTDNRVANIRLVTSSENSQNQHKANSRNKSSGILGVRWAAHANKWSAQIQVNGKSKHIGYFKNKDDAYQAYLSFKKILHPASNLAILAI